MDGSWAGPSSFGGSSNSSSSKNKNNNNNNNNNKTPKQESKEVEDDKYFALIIDSGAIIKHSGFSTLHNSALQYCTTQGVVDEIRDSRARHHLESLPFQLVVKEPSAHGITKVVEFSKKTGDYASLSAVDLDVLALLYDLEKEGCGSMEHIRVQPKRMIGNGRVVKLKNDDDTSTVTSVSDNMSISSNAFEANSSFFESRPIEETVDDNDYDNDNDDDTNQTDKATQSSGNVSWAKLVNPKAPAPSSVPTSTTKEVNVADAAISSTFGSMTLTNAREMLDTMQEEKNDSVGSGGGDGGQFSDADDDESIEIPLNEHIDDDSSEDGEEYADIGDDFSDEECDVYILDPEELEEKEKYAKAQETETVTELEMEFPSLAAASTVPYAGSDDEGGESKNEEMRQMEQSERLKKAEEEFAKKRAASLAPVSKSGKLYNTLGKYSKLASAKGVTNGKRNAKTKVDEKNSFSFAPSPKEPETSVSSERPKSTQSRVMGGVGMSGQSTEVDDDGEGWVTSTKEIVAMKATGTLDPFRDNNKNQQLRQQENLPLKQCRTACATTDFAMQNVILQMNLELLTVDGVRVRKLKSWVQRCAACFEVYTAVDSARLFCKKCGSSAIQRVAASVDGKTGRLKLHLKKNYQHSLRGTKFSLPKPGKQNRFMGDLLLSEDQLMYGALNQRKRQSKSKKVKAAQSIFGADIATTVGCNADLSKRGDLRVGFGRKNPNSTKFGRERRGKKKVSTDKVCGLRRY